MTTTIPEREATRRAAIWLGALIAAGVAAALNVAVYALATSAGATMTVDMQGSPMTVTLGPVVGASIIPLVAAGLVAWPLARRWPMLRTWFAWAGLAFGVATVPMSLIATGDAVTGWSLASMHVIAGAAWFAALMISAAEPKATNDARMVGGSIQDTR
ncbi:DUF6069 family protein [Agromyces mangrovi Wang et al. 2018]|uniref:DUF6069 family protein n=1 Tax=Agromyces mangrovi TaxID=1858653 RepID=UPI0025722D20|nr:DUF6069 family protein [Agromyces mangrovi]BDZ64771.1 hypothetical protein GCM10025877_17090 [Agromyces mangrovi]